MTRIVATMAVVALVQITNAPVLSAQVHPAASDTAQHAVVVKTGDMKWNVMFPELGARSSEISILRVDPTTHATQLMIRVPPHFHVPPHWHSANETHTVVSGRFIIECEGKREVLAAGSFNYVPSKMVHEAWTTPKEGALLFITVDAAWDIAWVKGPPKPQALLADMPR